MSRRNLVGGVNVGLNPDASSKTNTNNHINNNVIIKTGGSAGDAANTRSANECIGEVPLQPTPEIQVHYEVPSQNPYADVDERDIESAEQILKTFNAIGIPDRVYAEALTLVIDIIHSNPLIQNKFIIAHHDELCLLLKLLTQVDEVKINLDEDAGCCGIKSIAKIESIVVIKDDVCSDFKYTFPLVKSLMNQLRISTKLLAL